MAERELRRKSGCCKIYRSEKWPTSGPAEEVIRCSSSGENNRVAGLGVLALWKLMLHDLHNQTELGVCLNGIYDTSIEEIARGAGCWDVDKSVIIQMHN